MGFAKVLLIIVLLVSLGLLGYYGYTTIMGKPFLPNWFSGKSDSKTDTGSGSWPKPDPIDAGIFKDCKLEEEDYKYGTVYRYDGTKITAQPKDLTCSNCNQYSKLSDDGGCVPYGFEIPENSPDGSTSGVCTGGLGVSKTCPKTS